MPTIYSNQINISVISELDIIDYNLTYDCINRRIVVSGKVVYKGNPISSAIVDIGFCSGMRGGYVSPADERITNDNGEFVGYVYTETPAGGQNCIASQAIYNGIYAVVYKNITIPTC